MLRDWCERFAVWRAERLSTAAEWWTDLAIALRTGVSLKRVRARRRKPRADVARRPIVAPRDRNEFWGY